MWLANVAFNHPMPAGTDFLCFIVVTVEPGESPICFDDIFLSSTQFHPQSSKPTV